MEEVIENGECEDLIEKFCCKISSQYAGEHIDGRTLFLDMPGKIKEFVMEIRNEHATLEFGVQGLETVGSIKKASALREKWLEAFKL
jgi:hypothetical protein